MGMFPAGNELLQRVSNGGRQLPWERQQSISWGKSGTPTHFCSWGGRATMTRTSSPLILARPSLWRWHRTQHLFPALGHVEEQGTEPANSTMHGQERLLTINEKWCYLQQSILSQTLTTVFTCFHEYRMTRYVQMRPSNTSKATEIGRLRATRNPPPPKHSKAHLFLQNFISI